MVGEVIVINRTTVMRRHGRDGGEAAVIAPVLANDG